MQIENNVFLITGGGSGLGAETAAMLVEQGGHVVIADVNQDKGVALAKRLGTHVRFVTTDVCNALSATQAVNTALTEFGGLHGLINCAGIAPAQRIVGKQGVHDLAAFSNVIQINLIGTFNMMRLAAEAMSKGKANGEGEQGVIINTASVAAFDGQIGQAAYAASKGGVVALTLPAARELARHGIRVMTIAPGIMETPMLLNMPQEVQESLGKMVPFPSRLGKPAEFSALVKMILENVYLNGEVIRLDGAIRLAPK